MPQDVAAYLLCRLQEQGIEHFFGYPGDGVNGITAAPGRTNAPPRFVQSRHEEIVPARHRTLTDEQPVALDVRCGPDIPRCPLMPITEGHRR